MTLEPITINAPLTLGAKGDDGKSPYELAVEEGYLGTQAEWVASLQGAPGQAGAPGPNLVGTATATDITGLLAGDGGNVRKAVAGTDYAPAIHTHALTQISDASALGRIIASAADGAAVRGLIGAGTGDGDFKSDGSVPMSAPIQFGASGPTVSGNGSDILLGAIASNTGWRFGTGTNPEIRVGNNFAIWNYSRAFRRFFFKVGSSPGIQLGSDGALMWSVNTDAGSTSGLSFSPEGANSLAIRGGIGGSGALVYGADIDASNYSRLSLSCDTSGNATITTEGAGTGSAGTIKFHGSNRAAFVADATDATETQSLVNDLKAAFISHGFMAAT